MAFEKGNTWSVGIDNGRPLKYETPEQLEEAIDKYFNEDHKTKTVIIGKAPNQEAVEMPCITITGLAYYLGFESRQSFYDYEKRKDFSYIIKRARLFIEQEYENALQYGNVTGAIFALKNMGWKDKVEQEQHIHMKDKISLNINFQDFSDEES